MTQIHSIPKELSSLAPLRLSKWIHYTLLISSDELENLLELLSPCFLLKMNLAPQLDKLIIDKALLLKNYTLYLKGLLEEDGLDLKTTRDSFHLYLSQNLNDIYYQELPNQKFVLKLFTPSIIIKPICLAYSTSDHSLKPAPLSQNGISFGLDISFAHLMQDPKTFEINTINPKNDPNAKLFSTLRSWIRKNTFLPHFFNGEQKISSDVKIGINCKNWINDHLSLKKNNLHVKND